MSKHLHLSTAFRCINDRAGIDGLVSTLLVIGSFPKLGIQQKAPAPTTLERANAVHTATKLDAELLKKARVSRAAKSGTSANSLLIYQVPQLEANPPVIVYRENRGSSDLHPFTCADDHGAWFQNEKGNDIRVSLHAMAF